MSAPDGLVGAGAIVAGGTTGVGLASAVALARAGTARIVLLGRSVERGKAACTTVQQVAPGVQVAFVPGDLEDLAALQGAAERSRELLGQVDVLVNSVAGPVTPTLLLQQPTDQLSATLDAVVLPAIHLTHVVLGWMVAQESGSIVTVASDAGRIPTPGESVIGAGMAALAMFTRTAALEAKRAGVRLNVVTPSLIDGTPTTERIMQDPFTAKLFGKAASQAHLGLPDAADVADLVVFLAGPGARRMTGQVVSVNGGISVA